MDKIACWLWQLRETSFLLFHFLLRKYFLCDLNCMEIGLRSIGTVCTESIWFVKVETFIFGCWIWEWNQTSVTVRWTMYFTLIIYLYWNKRMMEMIDFEWFHFDWTYFFFLSFFLYISDRTYKPCEWVFFFVCVCLCVYVHDIIWTIEFCEICEIRCFHKEEGGRVVQSWWDWTCIPLRNMQTLIFLKVWKREIYIFG